MSQTHFIQKENIQIVFTTQAVAEEHWDSLLEFHKSEGQQVIEEVFDKVASENDWVRIDSLSVDLGKISTRHFRQEYLELLRSSLQKALLNKLENEKNSATVDKIMVWEDTIVHYLKFGTILWASAMQSTALVIDLNASQKQILEDKIAELLSSSQSFRNTLGQAIRNSSVAMQRWIRQFTASFHDRVQRLLLEQTSGSFKLFVEKSCKLIDSVQSIQSSNSRVTNEEHQSTKWKILFSDSLDTAVSVFSDWVLQHLHHMSVKRSVMLILERGVDLEKLELIECLTNHPQVFNKSDEHSAIIGSALDELIKRSSIASVDETKGPDITEQTEVIESTGKVLQTVPTKGSSNKENQSGNKKRSESKSDTEEENEIYIDNAGMVLLAPFLQHFFEENGIDIKNNLEDDEDASLCIHLLQHLATNKWDENEDRLSLNKILCGRPISWAPFQFTIPDTAASKCEELLQAVIHHWSALKNTSIEGLQETFLRREGKLTLRKEQWELFINYKTADILLQSIPWTFSVIKLPWMKHPLFVNW